MLSVEKAERYMWVSVCASERVALRSVNSIIEAWDAGMWSLRGRNLE